MQSTKVQMTFDEYDHIVEVCEKMKDNFADNSVYATKLNFTQMHQFPTVEQLQSHHVEKNLQKYLRMLIFYLEVYQNSSPQFKRTQQYIRQLIYDNVELTD